MSVSVVGKAVAVGMINMAFVKYIDQLSYGTPQGTERKDARISRAA